MKTIKPLLWAWVLCAELVGAGLLVAQCGVPSEGSAAAEWLANEEEQITLNRIVGTREAADVLVIGNSRAREAVVAPLLAQAVGVPGRKTRNYGAASCNAATEYALLRLIVSHGKAPRVIVYPVSPRDLTRFGAPPSYFLPLLVVTAAPYLVPREQFSNWIFCAAQRQIKLVWLRDAFEKPYPFSVPAIGAETKAQARHRREKSYRRESSFQRHPLNEYQLADYMLYTEMSGVQSLNATQKDWARRTIRLARDSGCALIVVELPLSTLLRAVYPPGVYDDFCAFFHEACEQNGVRFIRLSDLGVEFTDADIADMAHCNWSGAEKFTKAIAPFVSNALKPVTNSSAVASAGTCPAVAETGTYSGTAAEAPPLSQRRKGPLSCPAQR